MFTPFELLYIVTLFVVIYIAKRYFDSLSSIRDLKLLEIQLSQNIDNNIVDKLDDYLEDIFNDYILSSPKYLQQPYINSKDEEQMRQDLVDLVSDRMSPYLYQKLAIYYNENSIPDILANKIFLLVTAFVANKNTPKQNIEDVSL